MRRLGNPDKQRKPFPCETAFFLPSPEERGAIVNTSCNRPVVTPKRWPSPRVNTPADGYRNSTLQTTSRFRHLDPGPPRILQRQRVELFPHRRIGRRAVGQCGRGCILNVLGRHHIRSGRLHLPLGW